MWFNFEFESVLFRRDTRHNDRVDSIWECVTKQAVLQGPNEGPHSLTGTSPHLS